MIRRQMSSSVSSFVSLSEADALSSVVMLRFSSEEKEAPFFYYKNSNALQLTMLISISFRPKLLLNSLQASV